MLRVKFRNAWLISMNLIVTVLCIRKVPASNIGPETVYRD
jgi:hypothetical protein